MNTILLLFFALVVLVKSAPLYDDEKVYYWQPYKGTIPTDAILGGKTIEGLPTYIGQVYFDGAIIPTEIRVNQTKVYFGWVEAKFVTDNIKILCSKHPEQFEWIKVTEKNSQYLWEKHIVMGGFIVGENKPFLIGRISHQNRALIVGEARINDKEVRIWYVYEGALFSVVNEDMELLSYNTKLAIEPSKTIVSQSKTAKKQNVANRTVVMQKRFLMYTLVKPKQLA